MAIDVNNARFLLAGLQRGVSFKSTLTLGRLGLFLEPKVLDVILRDYQAKGGRLFPERVTKSDERFCEGFFSRLGAENTSAMDFSDYEGATHIYDLNVPIPTKLHNQFDTVVDGGTMEHVFNFPTAILNAMNMVKEGGHLILDLPANNCCGHGFYQFSPELFFRLFEPKRGFVIESICVAEDRPFSQFYEVKDPSLVKSRVNLVGAVPVHVYVRARKETAESKVAESPAQSDYTEYWRAQQGPHSKPNNIEKTTIKQKLRSVLLDYCPATYWRYSVIRNTNRSLKLSALSNHAVYKPVNLFEYKK